MAVFLCRIHLTFGAFKGVARGKTRNFPREKNPLRSKAENTERSLIYFREYVRIEIWTDLYCIAISITFTRRWSA